MIPNQDEHGIRYTMYSMNDIDAEMMDTLLYAHGKDLSYEAACKEEEARQRSEWEDECERLTVAAQEAGTDCVLDDFEPNFDNFFVDIDEPIIEGEHEGVHYRAAWADGEQLLMVFKSPIIGHFNLCQPGVSSACNGDEPTPRADGFCGYAVFPSWLNKGGAASIDWMGDLD